MHNLQSLKKSIEMAESLKSIVTTMKAYSSTNILQFQHAAQASMKYRGILDMALYVMLFQEEQKISVQKPEKGNTIHIVFGSDHGLAGRFNERICSFALEHIPKGKEHLLFAVGQQVFNRLENDFSIDASFSVPQTEASITSMVQRLLLNIDEFKDKIPIKKILLYYCRTLENSSIKEEIEVLFPINFEKMSKKNIKWKSNSIPTYFMNKDKLISELIRQYFFITIYRSFCYSLVTENTSRIESMNSAEKNIEERLEKLKFTYRQKRQTNITEEISDVISGFKSIKKAKNTNL